MNASIRIPHSGYRISTEEALSLLQQDEEALLTRAADLRDYGHGRKTELFPQGLHSSHSAMP